MDHFREKTPSKKFDSVLNISLELLLHGNKVNIGWLHRDSKYCNAIVTTKANEIGLAHNCKIMLSNKTVRHTPYTAHKIRHI